MANGRVIFHIDMNCYFVSCEIAENPELKDKPVAVAPMGSTRKSIILTASYEARKFGVHSAMRVSDALRLCPELILIDCHMDLYSEYSSKFFNYFLSVTPLVEPASIDEAYLDVTDVCKNNEYLELAKQMQDYLNTKLNLPCSIGIAPNKFLAKMGSDMKKPLGITVVRKREIQKVLWPLPIEDMQGVGRKTLKQLEFLKIKTIGDLANYPDYRVLCDLLGENSAKSLKEAAFGEGDNQINVSRFTDFSSVSNSQTFDVDLFDTVIILDNLKILVNTVANRLVHHDTLAKTFSIQIKYNNFKSITRSKTIDEATNDNQIIFGVVKELFEEYYDERLSVRLLGVAATKLTENKVAAKQLTIFDNLTKEEKDHNIKQLLKDLNNQYGKDSLVIGIKPENTEKNNKNIADKYNKDYLNDLKAIRRH